MVVMALLFNRGRVKMRRILYGISHMVSDKEIPIIKILDVLKEMKHNLEDRYEEAIKSRENMRRILQSISDGILIIDQEEKIIMSNSIACELLGIKDSSLDNKRLVEVLENYDMLNFVEKNLKNFTNDSSEISILYPKRHFLKCDAIPVVLNEDDKVLIAVIKDVTKEMELDIFRREFISNVSHELRTPLTSIHGYSETILDDDLSDPEMTKHFVGIIEAESARMNRLINDLLDLQKLEEGKAVFNFDEIYVDDVVEYVSRIVKPMAESLDVNVKVSCHSGVTVDGDFDRLVQAILNLVDNAIKYTSQKENGRKLVEVSCSVKGNKCEISIKDTGMGIPSDSIPRLFDRFYRVDKARARKVGGTGLGLSIVKMIVERHGGHIEVSSEQGIGSEFKIVLPTVEE